jgi:hypothetical protein
VLLWVNGQGFKGVFRFGRDYFRGRKAAREFEKTLKGKK